MATQVGRNRISPGCARPAQALLHSKIEESVPEAPAVNFRLVLQRVGAWCVLHYRPPHACLLPEGDEFNPEAQIVGLIIVYQPAVGAWCALHTGYEPVLVTCWALSSKRAWCATQIISLKG